MGTVSNGDFRTLWKELFQEKDPTQVGIYHSPWGSEWDNGCQYYVFIVSGTKLSLTIEHNEYNLGRKTKLQIQARSFKPQYLCTFYLKALYKEKGIVSQFIYGGCGRDSGQWPPMGHQWNGAKRDQLGAKYPTATARGSCRWRLQCWSPAMQVAAWVELLEHAPKVTDGSHMDGGQRHGVMI